MLILTRKPGEVIYIGDEIKITIVEIKGSQIRVGIDAPADLRIYRKEIYDQIQEENRMAASGADLSGLEGLPSFPGSQGGNEEGTPARQGLGVLTTQKVQKHDPQVVLKRKKDRKPNE